ncbi:hypothetical protein [Heliophilum fasciatum]|uniref:DUF4149 domain-containing protein n=1 Tax=Heliophilum fasciatum TaxID=35700 RepID=A0A4R2RG79_9FIRM|nr:hypothetical protein [Heliophilum fasciatum]MCW2278626.1 hypothetical protein [Heliophilum fasciatum]TCP62672.1 hypothetical protein EDD73_11920 [Heliophilum fasciatum]
MGSLIGRTLGLAAGFLLVWVVAYRLGGWMVHNRYDDLLYFSGWLGTVMVLASLGYSVKKLWKPLPGKLGTWLDLHMVLSMAGNFFVCLHVGGRSFALVPWLTFVFFLVVMLSGLVGYYLHFYSKRKIAQERKELKEEGLAPAEQEEALAWLITGEQILAGWRKVHIPLNITLGLLLLLHIVSALYYRGV